MEHEKTIAIGDIVRIIRRRRKAILLPAASVFVLSILVALIWTPVYQSSSTILIEEQDISREYVMTTITSLAEQRLQIINQRIMSSERLLQIIRQFNLYADKKDRYTTEEIVDDMRKKDIKFNMITAEVVDRRTGRPTTATIAFTVSYEGKNPVVVQQVANVLASLYLEENSKVVGQQTAATTKFLEEEMRNVQAELAEIEKRIATYKEKNPGALPELLTFNMQALDTSDQRQDALQNQLRSLRERESYLQTELMSVTPDTVDHDRTRLKELRAQLVRLVTRYSDEYPDVSKTKAEIAELEKKLQTKNTRPAVEERPDNPAYISLAAQLASVQSEIRSTQRQIDAIDQKRAEYRKRIELSPRVEEGYKQMLAERNSTQAKYDDLMKKYMEARVAQGLEKGQMGDRFTLIDPAKLPEKPSKPNRMAILLIGLVLGMGAGVGTAALQEATDRSARRAEDITAVLPWPVMAEVPEIVTIEDELQKKQRMKHIIIAVAFAMVAGILIIHYFVIDLDVLWARLSRRLGL